MDHRCAKSVNTFVGAALPPGESNNPINQAFVSMLKADDVQLLKDAANKYLHSYAAWGDAEGSLDPGALARTFVHVEPIVVEAGEWGVPTASGGERDEATYTLNPEFFELRDRVGSYRFVRNSDRVRSPAEKAQVYLGIAERKRSQDCRSAEARQFEVRSRELTATGLDNRGTIPPTAANEPPLVERTIAPAFDAVPATVAATSAPIATIAPVRLPVVSAPAVVETRRFVDKPTSIGSTGASPPTTCGQTGFPAR